MGLVAGTLALLSCGGTTAESPAPPPPPPTAAAVVESYAGFTIYTQDETLLVTATDPPRAVRAPGVWLAQPGFVSRVVHHAVPGSPDDVGLPPCVCQDATEACIDTAVRRTIDVAAGFEVVFDEPCSCYGTAASALAPDVATYVSNEDDCEAPPAGPVSGVSVVAGTLFALDSGSTADEECGDSSYNLYSAWSVDVTLVEGLDAPVVAAGDATSACTEALAVDAADFFGPDGLLRTGLLRAVERDEAGPEEEERDHDACEEVDESGAYPIIRNGRVCRVSFGMRGDGLESSWAACALLRPGNCPSSLDPCGDPAPFREHLPERGAYWVSTDGLHALVADGEGWSLLTPGQAPRRVPELAAEPVLGVHFFSNAAPLAAAMAHDFSLDPEERVACDDGSCSGEQRCDGETSTCHAPCARDSDCAAFVGRCGARCRLDGTCGPAPVGICDSDEHPCDEGYFCQEGQCVTCRTTADCGEGRCDEGACTIECSRDRYCGGERVCVEGRCEPPCERGVTASAWGNRCFQSVRDEEWSEADRRCRCGLGADPSSRTRGAILYNLGRAAEARSRVDAARTFYRESLDARPGNETVRRRLDALPAR